ncbi:FecR family protein [Bacteroides sp.]
MKKEKDKRQKIRRYLDGIYSKSEVSDLLKNMQNPEMQDTIDKVAEEMWEESMEQTPYLCDIEHERYKREALTLLRKINKRPSYKRIIWTAACVALMLSIGLGINNYPPTQQKEVLYTAISTSFGEKKEFTLPDGSKVNLNACTTLKYPEQFNGKERKVELTGEAYFQVSKNEKQPFIIQANGFDVKVLGTKFNVKAYAKNETALVSVESGKVQVNLPEAMMRLVANEQVQINTESNEYIKRHEDYKEAMAWMQSKLHYENASLYDVIKDLERYYNCRFKFTADQVFNHRFSGEHDNKSLQAVLQSIEYATGIKSKKEGEYIVLYQE